jgi:hypothetical protein
MIRARTKLDIEHLCIQYGCCPIPSRLPAIANLRLLALPLTQNAFEELQGIGADLFGQGDELWHGDLTLLTLDHSDDRVRASDSRGELPLRQASLLASFSKHARNCPGSGTSQRLQPQCAPIY